jgi:hypothetical protein
VQQGCVDPRSDSPRWVFCLNAVVRGTVLRPLKQAADILTTPLGAGKCGMALSAG